ncbi:MAG TPA: alpha/beta fold hydrolase [Gaiellaceae bacterium]
MSAAFAERRVQADGFDVRVCEAGSGEPLVYLHGGGGLHLNETIVLLAEQFQVLAIELPGFGASAENTRTASFDELACTIVAAAGIDGAYTLVGTSFGGVTALHVALRDPAPIAALVLIGPAAFRPPGWALPEPDALMRALFKYPERVALPPPPPEEVIEKQMRLVSRLIGTIDEEALRRRLPGLRVPTLVLFGAEDGVIPPELGRVYRELMPNCSLVYIDEAAHEVAVDRPETVAALIADFARLRRV